jgi:hypothetical protein
MIGCAWFLKREAVDDRSFGYAQDDKRQGTQDDKRQGAQDNKG